MYDKYVSGVWQNPYDEKQVFAIAAPVLKYNSLTMQVELPSSLWYTNQGSTVQSISIDFNDGLGYQTISFGQIKTVTYTQPGIKEWKYQLTLTNNQILYSHSKIQIDAEVPPIATSSTLRTINQPCSVNAFGIDQVEFSGSRQYIGTANSATLEIDYAGTNSCGSIRKPLIVVEGFDSGLLGVESALGENDYLGFRRTASTLLAGNLRGQLNTYDIIYVNWNSGKDYLQRNAYLLEDIIKWVNVQKAVAGSTTPNVVLGQSMGGVIARYALRDMENRSEAHQTSLYISHDAPHQGANIPLSIQYFARHLVDQFVSTPLGDMNINPNDGAPVSIEDIQTLLNAPGTKQLLINNVASNFSIDNNFAIAWQTELKNLGYPQLTRNIALSNGNHCANPQDYLPNATLFSLSGNGKTSFLTSFLTELLGPLNAANDVVFVSLAVLFNEPGLLIGVLPGNSKFNMDFNAKALPNVGTIAQIYKGKLTFTKKLFWLLNITVTLTDRNYNNPTGILSYDYYSGGKYPVPFDFENSSVSNAFFSFGITAQIAKNFNFIPTPSSLDIGKGLVVLNNNDYFVKYNAQNPPLAPKNTPFINFTTSFQQGNNINENHISFNTRNGNWLASELDSDSNNNDTFNCSYICTGTQISGPNTICTTANYSVPAISGGTYNWTITEGATLVTFTGNGTSNIIVTRVGTGKVTIQLTYGNSTCGNLTLTKSTWVGFTRLAVLTNNSGTPYNPSALPDGCVSYNAPFWTFKTSSDFDNVSEFIFTYNNGSTITKTAIGGRATITAQELGMLEGQSRTVIVSPKNLCGVNSRNVSFTLYKPTACQCGFGNNCNLARMATQNIYVIYPNPSNDIVNIDLMDANSKLAVNATVSGELFDLMGQSKLKVDMTNTKTSFSVVGLAKGIYVLQINMDGVIESHQVFVE